MTLRRIAFLGSILFASVQSALSAQPVSLDQIPALRDRTLVVRCVSRVVEQNQQVVWHSENSRITIPGRPVGLRLVGSDLVVVVQFTPFVRPNGRITLVAHGQTWINVPNEGMSYHTTMQTIPLELGEPVYFFPLGSKETDDEAYIEIQIILEPHAENSPVENVENTENHGEEEIITPQ